MAALLALGATGASAQEAGETRFGVTAGMNLSNITDMDLGSRIGFHIGVRGDYNFTDKMYLGAGVLFSQKGTRKSEDGVTASMNPGYIEVPIHFGYRFYKSDDISVFGEVGPYFAIGICGKQKISYDGQYKEAFEDVYGSSEIEADIFGDNGAKRFDAGLGLRVGVEFSKFQVSLGYDLGLTNMYDGGGKNRNFTVGVTYMF